MENLPPELLRTILLSSVHLCRSEKNLLLRMRLVNRRFDFILREYLLKTVQLDFSRFVKGEGAPNIGCLKRVGPLCKALYCDMMVIRDDGMLPLLCMRASIHTSCHAEPLAWSTSKPHLFSDHANQLLQKKSTASSKSSIALPTDFLR